ncbi:helix-turn-helix domain-containing protein [Gaetbulibacter aestuarii]|uniref:Helix-turn-helix domain-containing protein n=1 Tax=Gaetbulibacter aestuarii TaxID=1502358 RepID=A0ABW7N171_9FLAO
MKNYSEEIVIPSVGAIKNLLEPIMMKLEHLDSVIKENPSPSKRKKYYRNADLKSIFGISPNTIIKYRETGVLPYTKLGDIYLYEVKEIDAILNDNNVKL